MRKKPTIALMMLMLTFLSAGGMMFCHPHEQAVTAPFATVSRADVHQIVPLTGRLTYAEETLVCARGSGTVKQICITEGQRVEEGEALIRMDAASQNAAVSAFVAQAVQMGIEQELPNAEYSVIRAERPCSVRQVLVHKDDLVTAGTPLARTTSNEQEIVCNVVKADLKQLQPGMWAWLAHEGERIGIATIVEVGELQADSLSGLTSATVRLRPEQHSELPEGASVDVDVYLCGSDDVLSLPLQAITEKGTVWWVHDGRCAEIPARIVLCDEMRAWVDLPEGLTVAIGAFSQGQRILEEKT